MSTIDSFLEQHGVGHRVSVPCCSFQISENSIVGSWRYTIPHIRTSSHGVLAALYRWSRCWTGPAQCHQLLLTPLHAQSTLSPGCCRASCSNLCQHHDLWLWQPLLHYCVQRLPCSTFRADHKPLMYFQKVQEVSLHIIHSCQLSSSPATATLFNNADF